MIQVRLILRPRTDLSHVGPEDFLSATLSEDEFQGIFKANFGWLSSAKHKVARNLHSTLSSLLLYPARLKEPVWSLELHHRREAWHPVCVCSRSDRTSTRRLSSDCSARAFWRLPSSSSGIFHFWSTHILIMTIVRPLYQPEPVFTYPSFSNSIMIASLAVAAMIDPALSVIVNSLWHWYWYYRDIAVIIDQHGWMFTIIDWRRRLIVTRLW